MKRKIYVLLLAFAASAIFVGCSGGGQKNVQSPALTEGQSQTENSESSEVHEPAPTIANAPISEMELTTETRGDENHVISLTYPIATEPADSSTMYIDEGSAKLIKERIEELVTTFEPVPKDNQKTELIITSGVYEFNTRVFTVVYDICVNDDGVNDINRVRTQTIDRVSAQNQTLNDYFTGEFLETFSKIATQKLVDEHLAKGNTTQELIDEGMAPKEQYFENFVLLPDGMIRFYFDEYSVANGPVGIVSVEIPFTDLPDDMVNKVIFSR